MSLGNTFERAGFGGAGEGLTGFTRSVRYGEDLAIKDAVTTFMSLMNFDNTQADEIGPYIELPRTDPLVNARNSRSANLLVNPTANIPLAEFEDDTTRVPINKHLYKRIQVTPQEQNTLSAPVFGSPSSGSSGTPIFTRKVGRLISLFATQAESYHFNNAMAHCHAGDVFNTLSSTFGFNHIAPFITGNISKGGVDSDPIFVFMHPTVHALMEQRLGAGSLPGPNYNKFESSISSVGSGNIPPSGTRIGNVWFMPYEPAEEITFPTNVLTAGQLTIARGSNANEVVVTNTHATANYVMRPGMWLQWTQGGQTRRACLTQVKNAQNDDQQFFDIEGRAQNVTLAGTSAADPDALHSATFAVTRPLTTAELTTTAVNVTGFNGFPDTAVSGNSHRYYPALAIKPSAYTIWERNIRDGDDNGIADSVAMINGVAAPVFRRSTRERFGYRAINNPDPLLAQGFMNFGGYIQNARDLGGNYRNYEYALSHNLVGYPVNQAKMYSMYFAIDQVMLGGSITQQNRNLRS